MTHTMFWQCVGVALVLLPFVVAGIWRTVERLINRYRTRHLHISYGSWAVGRVWQGPQHRYISK